MSKKTTRKGDNMARKVTCTYLEINNRGVIIGAGQEVEIEIGFPDTEKPFWMFKLPAGITYYCTGDVTARCKE